ncbi:MAG: response regulator [Saprospiraceae bacterium]
MKLLRLFFILPAIVCALLPEGTAQNIPKLDSLRNIVAQAEGKAKIVALDSLIDALYGGDPEEYGKLVGEMESLARRYDWKEQLIKAWQYRGRHFQMQGKYDSLRIFSRNCIHLLEEQNITVGKGRFYNYIGIYHEKGGSVDSAIYYYQRALEDSTVDQLAINNNLGLAYGKKQTMHIAVEYLEKAILEARKRGNINAEAIIANNIGGAYLELHEQEKAIAYFKKAIALKEKLGDKRGILFPLTNLITNDTSAANLPYYFDKGLKLAKEVRDTNFIHRIQFLYADLMLRKQGRYKEALDLLMTIYVYSKQRNIQNYYDVLLVMGAVYCDLGDFGKAEALINELTAASEQEGRSYFNKINPLLLKIYAAQGNYKRYYEVASRYYPVKDSLEHDKSRAQLAYLEYQLDNTEKEKEIVSLNNTLQQKEARRKWFTAIALLIGLLLSLLIYFRSRQVKIQRKLAQDLEAMNNELKSVDEMKSRFFTNISHELRTPLTLISTPVRQFLDTHGNSLGDQGKQTLGLVHRNAGKLLSLIEELLELSQLDAGKIRLDPTPTALFSFCRQLFSSFESRAQLKNIDYQFHYEPDKDLQVLLDQRKFEKIVNNLLANALKFTPADGMVRLMVRSEAVSGNASSGQNISLLLSVTDSGRGIPAEDLPHVFDRYFQTKHKGISTEGGTGIGLALAKELAYLMQGHLTVSSEWGNGSAFQLRIPLAVTTDQQAERATPVAVSEPPVDEWGASAPSATEHTLGLKKGKILIVEDNPDMQLLITSILADTYDCRLANNGLEAWNLLEREDPSVAGIHLILSDVMMPEMDGYTLLERIKAHDRWRQVPAVILTARAAREDKLQALRMGVDDFLTKPFAPEELLARVDNLVSNYQKRRAYIKRQPLVDDIKFEKTASASQRWLKELEEATLYAIDKKIDLNVLYLANAMARSDRQLLRRLKAETGLSVNGYIQEIKLQYARHLLENKIYRTISEVAFSCGFNTPGYFTQLYRKRFGKAPGDSLQEDTHL